MATHLVAGKPLEPIAARPQGNALSVERFLRCLVVFTDDGAVIWGAGNSAVGLGDQQASCVTESLSFGGRLQWPLQRMVRCGWGGGLPPFRLRYMLPPLETVPAVSNKHSGVRSIAEEEMPSEMDGTQGTGLWRPSVHSDVAF